MLDVIVLPVTKMNSKPERMIVNHLSLTILFPKRSCREGVEFHSESDFVQVPFAKGGIIVGRHNAVIFSAKHSLTSP